MCAPRRYSFTGEKVYHQTQRRTKSLRLKARVLTPQRLTIDLEDIWNYTAEQNIEATHKTIRELMKTFRLLAENPAIGKEKPEFIVGVRSFPHKKYNVFYFPITDGVEIFRVIHGSRNIEDLFDDYFEGLSE